MRTRYPLIRETLPDGTELHVWELLRFAEGHWEVEWSEPQVDPSHRYWRVTAPTPEAVLRYLIQARTHQHRKE